MSMVLDDRHSTLDIDEPDREAVQRLLDSGVLTGAEQEAVSEFLTQSFEEWEREVNLENSTHYLLTEEMAEHGICSLVEARHAEKGYASALMLRVQGIFQNHGI